MSSISNIGNKIRLLRKAHGETQYDLAEFLGVSRTMIAHYEKGTYIPMVEGLRTLSEHYNVPIDYFLSSAEEDELARVKSYRDLRDLLTEYTPLLYSEDKITWGGGQISHDCRAALTSILSSALKVGDLLSRGTMLDEDT